MNPLGGRAHQGARMWSDSENKQHSVASACQLWRNCPAFVLQHLKGICAFCLQAPYTGTAQEENSDQNFAALLTQVKYSRVVLYKNLLLFCSWTMETDGSTLGLEFSPIDIMLK